MTLGGTILCSTEINAKFILSSRRVVGDADPYKASPPKYLFALSTSAAI